MEKSNKLRVFPFAKFQAVLLALVGLLAGIFYSFGGAIYNLLSTGSLKSGTALAFFALLGMPIIFAAFGIILGLLEAYLFNVIAKWFGGINLDFIRE
jgi:hypothetical protein